jgi:single-stranded-DNA-specific exonuclease
MSNEASVTHPSSLMPHTSLLSMTSPDFASEIGGHPIVADILWRRGIRDVAAARAFLDPDLYAPVPPEQLPGMREAVERLQDAIARGERVRVWGDFDADGQTATSVLVLGLRALGAVVDFTIPNRAHHSHGLNKSGIARAAEEGVRVLLTCDCGVTDYEEIAFARRSGIDVIISDHHDLGPALPEACAVINPKRLAGDHPIAHLPGVGVAYKLIEGLAENAEEKRRSGAEERGSDFSSAPPLLFSPAQLLDLVALGIVADVAYQRDDTRYLLQRGLARLRAHPRPGVRALLRVANIEPADLSEDGIGYQIGPRLNAVGRLDDATLSVELLTTDDEARANQLAARVEALNQERKVLQRAVEEDAFRQINHDPGLLRHAAIVLTSTTWHPSVLGVVASSVSNRYGKPAVLVSVKPGEIGRGSARSVRGIDIHAAITAQGELIETSGGHPMAAGFGIRSENVPAFRAGISRYVAAHAAAYEPADDQPEATLAWRDVSLRLCEDLERLAPFGPGNPRPLLKSENLRPVRVEPLGNDGKHQAVHFQDENGIQNRALWWRSAGQDIPAVCDLTYTLQRDTFRGKSRLQIQVVNVSARRAADSRSPATVTVSGLYRLIDNRGTLNRAAEIDKLIAEYGPANVQLWDDLAPDAGAGHRSRLQLEPKPILVILSAPPGHDELATALDRALPQTVVLMTLPPGPEQDQAEAVLSQVMGMLKVSEQRGESPADPTVIARMAARIGQREVIVKAVLEQYEAQLAEDWPAATRAAGKSVYFLEETRAYRRYFQEVAAETVLSLSA